MRLVFPISVPFHAILDKKNTGNSPAACSVAQWSSSCSGAEEKGKNASGGLGSFLRASPGRLHFKGGTAAKSSHFEEVIQGVE